jgi:hypothetical protein
MTSGILLDANLGGEEKIEGLEMTFNFILWNFY